MIGEALRLLRTFHDLKLKDLADRLDLSASYVSELENGKKEPSIEIIKRYADEFRTTPSTILFFSEPDSDDRDQKPLKDLVRRKILEFLHRVENEGKTTIS